MQTRVLTPELLADRVGNALHRAFGQFRGAVYRVADAAAADPRAAKNWWDRTNPPSGTKLVQLMIECEEVADEINRLVQESRCHVSRSSLKSDGADSDGPENYSPS